VQGVTICLQGIIAYGDDSLKKATQTLRILCFTPFQGEIKPPAMRAVVDFYTT
jgi:DNA-directed RNA polymerase subunit E'/Rpb7